MNVIIDSGAATG